MATYAIGDVQGCYDDLMHLLDSVDYNEHADRLWFVGDLINRGPRSLQTLQYIHALGERATCVLGNHDLHLLATASGVRRPHKTDTLQPILASARREELLNWLRRQPLIHHDPALNTVMVHAGIYPGWSLAQAKKYAAEVQHALRTDPHQYLQAMYGNQPDRWSEDLTGHDRLRFITNSLTRMRFVTADRRLNLRTAGPVGSQPAELQPWFRLTTALHADLNIVFGHWATLGCSGLPRYHALDSGCVWGNALTALKLETLEYFRVPCKRFAGA